MSPIQIPATLNNCTVMPKRMQSISIPSRNSMKRVVRLMLRMEVVSGGNSIGEGYEN